MYSLKFRSFRLTAFGVKNKRPFLKKLEIFIK